VTTFDTILPKIAEILSANGAEAAGIAPLVVNRDLNGRIRLIVDERHDGDAASRRSLDTIAGRFEEALGPHAFPGGRAVLFEADIETFLRTQTSFPLYGYPQARVIDRLATDDGWSSVSGGGDPSTPARIVFYSIKGGVGRSTALAAAAWRLAEQGHRVMVLDLDLESPGLSSSLLPADRRPPFGMTDWLVEDLVDNGDAILKDMFATSALSRDGEIIVVPAHGADPGEYVAKLGRIWMPKVTADGRREPWADRLRRVIDRLVDRHSPDVLLIDSRAGIDDVASACVAHLGAELVLLFAVDGEQTWTGYRALFRHWRMTGVDRQIRERLQIVAAMVPETDGESVVRSLRDHAFEAFVGEGLYDAVAPGEIVDGEEVFSYDLTDTGAPHSPLPIRWHRGVQAIYSLHDGLHRFDAQQIQAIFGGLLSEIDQMMPVVWASGPGDESIRRASTGTGPGPGERGERQG
jgi:CO dehydrogenase nickel-insertion accessory protein CooC1